MLALVADPGDGVFDLVLVREYKSVGIDKYIVKLTAGRPENLPNVTVGRGRRLKLQWDGLPPCFDEEIRGAEDRSILEGSSGCTIMVEMQPGALELWLPQTIYPEERP